MTKNVGGIEKILRIVIGIVLIALVFVGPKTAWGWIGLLPLITGLIGWCPAWVPFGINTAKSSK